MTKKPKQEEDVVVQPVEAVIIKAVKAFRHDFKCRDFQYEIGKSYEISGELKICSKGFHACDENPFDVWEFYPVVDDDGKLTRYAATSHSGAIQNQKEGGHSKIASAKITIDAELSLPDFIRRAISWVIDTTKGKTENNDSGHSAQIGSSGHSAKIGSSGHYAQIGSSGDSAKISVEGSDAVIAAAGPGTSVSGVIGTWISLAEFNGNGKCIGFATGCIGQEGLEPGVKYVAKDGKLIRA